MNSMTGCCEPEVSVFYLIAWKVFLFFFVILFIFQLVWVKSLVGTSICDCEIIDLLYYWVGRDFLQNHLRTQHTIIVVIVFFIYYSICQRVNLINLDFCYVFCYVYMWQFHVCLRSGCNTALIGQYHSMYNCTLFIGYQILYCTEAPATNDFWTFSMQFCAILRVLVHFGSRPLGIITWKYKKWRKYDWGW